MWKHFKKDRSPKFSRLTSAFAALLLVSILVFSVLIPHQAKAAIAFDKNLGTNTVANDTGPSSTVALVTTQAAAAGSKIIIFVGWGAGTAITLSSVSGGSLTWNRDIQADDIGGAEKIAIASADAPSGLSSGTTITATFSTSGAGSRFISGTSFTGVTTGTTYDGTNHTTNGTNVWTGGTINTANANDLIIGLGVTEVTIGSSPVCTPSTNYTQVHCISETTSDSDNWESVYRIVSSTSSYTPGGTITNVTPTPNVTAGLAVAYKASVAVNSAPAAPTLSTPANAATGVSVLPQFQLRTTDANNDYLQYEIQVCSTSNCSSVVRTICQNAALPNSCSASQTGWSGQDQQTSTAYTGNSVIASSTMAVHTYQAAQLTANTQYWWRAYAIDPGGSNTSSSVSSISSFTTSTVPAAPTLISPSSAATGVSISPQFQLRTTDTESDYLKYFIQLYDAAACGGAQVGSDIDQTTSQTGWSGQDAQSGSAYTGSNTLASSTIASYGYAASLTLNHTYSWRAKAIDPGGSNTFSSLTSCQSFTTTPTASGVEINGGTTINGGSTIQ
jgi:hypothetical protein